MTSADYIFVAGCGAFFLWWVLSPRSVIRFYQSFSPLAKRYVAKEPGIRIIGALMIVLLLLLMLFGYQKTG